ncbi:MAG: hypothetical protein GC186_10200 [Rhodobacteraceae bacterium]|nr:hypothetical protein [Paracoccaceae bacterium]
MTPTTYAGLRPVLLAALAAASLASAGTASAVTADNNTKGIVGIQMTFGTKVAPEIFAGVVHASKSTSDHYSGAKALLYWDFVQGMMPSKFKILALDGGAHLQGELGGGYSFSQRGGFFTAGASGNNLTAGIDFSPNTGLAPYIGIQTPKRP